MEVQGGLRWRKRRHKDLDVSRGGSCSEKSVCDWKFNGCELVEFILCETLPLFMLSDGDFLSSRGPHLVNGTLPLSDHRLMAWPILLPTWWHPTWPRPTISPRSTDTAHSAAKAARRRAAMIP